jgi:hypothetical protein
MTLMHIVGFDAHGRNVLPAQGYMAGHTTRDYVWLFSLALPYVLGNLTEKVNLVMLDEDPVQFAGMKVARTRGAFDKRMNVAFCMWHKVTQKMQDSKTFGRADVDPNVYHLVTPLTHTQ